MEIFVLKLIIKMSDEGEKNRNAVFFKHHALSQKEGPFMALPPWSLPVSTLVTIPFSLQW